MPRALSLPDTLAKRVRAGDTELEIEALPSADLAREPGRPLHLVDSRGEVLATALADPENGVLRLLYHGGIDAFGVDFFRDRLEGALALRRDLSLLGSPTETAYRLLNGDGDGLSGFVADVYGDFVVLYVYSRGLLQAGRLLAQAILDSTNVRGVIVKVRPKGGQKPGKVQQQCVGDTPPERTVVRELDVPYEVHLLGGLNVGLFTDMREERRSIGRFVRGRRVLNTFAYTGALSVAAARAGATEVTSVDLSSGVLKWARENFLLSGLDPEAESFHFEVGDVRRYLVAQAREGRRFDTILLDPPTYSAARASGWSMKKDYPDLIAAAARLLPPAGGGLWVSSNTRQGKRLSDQIAAGMEKCGRHATVLEINGLPPDYPTPLGRRESRYLEVYHLRVEER